MADFKEISASELSFNPFDKIGKEWMLITSGDDSGWNTMTASWGFMGFIWGRNTAEVVIRPSRYTYEYMEKNELFTLSFFGEEYREALQFCGAHSGRDCDKAKETGLTPVFTDGTAAFEEAKLVLVCRKIYAQDMDLSCLDKDMHKFYADGGPMHRAYIGEIVKVLIKD